MSQIIKFTMFVSQENETVRNFILKLKSECERLNQDCGISVVNVLDMPEKAVENDIYVTPTVIRSLPEPVVKVLGDLSNVRKVLTTVEVIDPESDDSLVVIV